MLDLVNTAIELQAELDHIGLPNCIIGGLALPAWGEPRLTRDIDFNVITGFENEPEKVESILALVAPRMNNGLGFALENRIILGLRDGAIPVDIALGGFDYEVRMVNRAVLFELTPNQYLRICGAEDLVIMKTFAGRGQDWVDIGGILDRTVNLDWALIESELAPLLEVINGQDRLAQLQALRIDI